ncbi:MAG: hypothetical protein OQK12_17575 [Motiliproteus sp.]|nr:hypothetical protein [Motiliproteus sp.]MCW9053713.1 hypothetical protein [Motiliproteus sp.]
MIKALMVAACLFLITSISYAADSNGNFMILAYGTHSCGKFIDAADDAKNNNTWGIWNDYQAYTFGYFTGVNAYRMDTNNIQGTTDMEGIMAYIEKFCRENPLKEYFKAIDSVEAELYPQRSK